ncbi:MAG TPA: SDR family NAD(P)-dependent oxidoreductase [Ktedonobacterales bacterium]|jgi:NAD(P)-dependent dehydrogenase (short-subunit alcohol dehydrogenase family)|nr:SDR family NAD(P)-dependent oxidoreductase [Ktedonobacterales bacterium]
MTRLDGKVAIITGGGSGLGRAIALRYASDGAHVIAADINEAGARETVRLAGEQGTDVGQVDAGALDVTDEAAVAALVDAVMAEHGKLDVMVANAGIGTFGPIATLSLDDWRRVIDVNLTGVFLCAKYAFRAMQESGGVILATASVAGMEGTPNLGAYGPAKAGVIQLVKTVALEGARHNIRANALCPVWTNTPLVDALVSGASDPQRGRERLSRMVPLGRLGQPEDVANVAAFLASDEAAFLSGVAVPIDGGHTAGVGR